MPDDFDRRLKELLIAAGCYHVRTGRHSVAAVSGHAGLAAMRGDFASLPISPRGNVGAGGQTADILHP